MSDETSGVLGVVEDSRQGTRRGGLRKAALTSSTVTSRRRMPTKSVIEPSGTGTRSAVPSSLPFIASSTSPVARAAPVDVGMMLIAAARARRRSLWGPSTSIWSPV